MSQGCCGSASTVGSYASNMAAWQAAGVECTASQFQTCGIDDTNQVTISIKLSFPDCAAYEARVGFKDALIAAISDIAGVPEFLIEIDGCAAGRRRLLAVDISAILNAPSAVSIQHRPSLHGL